MEIEWNQKGNQKGSALSAETACYEEEIFISHLVITDNFFRELSLLLLKKMT